MKDSNEIPDKKPDGLPDSNGSLAVVAAHLSERTDDSRRAATLPHFPEGAAQGILAKIEIYVAYDPSKFTIELLKKTIEEFMRQRPPKKP